MSDADSDSVRSLLTPAGQPAEKTDSKTAGKHMTTQTTALEQRHLVSGAATRTSKPVGKRLKIDDSQPLSSRQVFLVVVVEACG